MTLALLMADPFAGTLVLLAGVWLAAKVGGEIALRLKLPTVAGELTAGLVLAGLHRAFTIIPDSSASAPVSVLANLGVLVLMFAVGLESTVPQMMRVGLPSLRVATVGVFLPMVAGLLGAHWLLPKGVPWVADLFIGACLCATSIGISAQTLREKHAAASPEGRVIVGAAVIDDVLGLLVLVAVSGLAEVTGAGNLPWAGLARTLGLALAFLALALTLGRRTTPLLFHLATRFRSEELLLPLGLAFAFLLAWLGNRAGLAPIVGAYAAGLILEPTHVQVLEARESHTLEALVHPLVTTLAPVFFVLMGARVDPVALLAPRTLLFGAVLAALGVLGTWAAGYAAGRGFRASLVGWGMVPRGEVGFVFVAAGAQLSLAGRPLLGPDLQAGIILALLLTTLAGPVGLSWVLSRRAPQA
jgi:Kef-type K+ transport system membrane component KefB